MKTRKFHKRIITALFISLITMTGCDAHGSERLAHKVYKLPVISDVETVVSTDKEVRLGGRSIHLTLLYEASRGKPLGYVYSPHKPLYVEAMVKRSSQVMRAFLREKGIVASECRGYKYNLIVSVVSRHILQDENRFRGFYKMRFGTEKVAGRTLYGYYDSTPEVVYNSSILLADMGPRLNEAVIIHELAHYWWDRLCIASHVSGTSESFAQAFEAYYLRRN